MEVARVVLAGGVQLIVSTNDDRTSVAVDFLRKGERLYVYADRTPLDTDEIIIAKRQDSWKD